MPPRIVHSVLGYHSYYPKMFDAWITAFKSVGITLLASLVKHSLRQMMKDKTVIDQKMPFINNFTKISKL